MNKIICHYQPKYLPVPVLDEVVVTHWRSSSHAQMVVEASLRLARDNLVIALVARIIGRNKSEIGKYFLITKYFIGIRSKVGRGDRSKILSYIFHMDE